MLRSRILLTLSVLVLLSACGAQSSASATDDGPVTLRLGYFPNLTHATALVGVDKGYFSSALGSLVTLETHKFNAGGDAVTALLSGAIDVSFIGPNPTTNAFVQSHGQAVRVVSGATSGGTLLVVKPSITSIEQLRGKRIADPQLGGTQDVALRWFLRSHGFDTDTWRSSRDRSMVRGCPSRGRAASWSKEAPAFSSMSATCGRIAPS